MSIKTSLYTMVIFTILAIIFTLTKIISLIKKIYSVKKISKNSTAFCSIIIIKEDEFFQNIISLLLAFLCILLFFYDYKRMKQYSEINFRPINYQTYYLMHYILLPIFYINSAIHAIITLMNSFFPTLITEQFIKVNCLNQYNREDVLFRLESDRIIILNSQTKDTIICINNYKKKKEAVLELLKLYYKEDIIT